jgi:hypothetical protein
MLKIQCPITGANYRLDQIKDHTVTVNALHPLFALPHKELFKLHIAGEDQQTSFLLLAVWLEKIASCTDLVTWRGKLEKDNFSLRWLDQELHRFIYVANWICENPTKQIINCMPLLSVSPQLTGQNVQEWRQFIQKEIESYEPIFIAQERSRLRREREYSAKVYQSADPIARRASSRRSYLLHCLGTHSNVSAVELVLHVTSNPNNYPVQTLRAVKDFCLDWLLEDSQENFNDKREVLELLDSAIVDKLSILEILSNERSAELAILRQNYYFEVDEGDFAGYNATNQKLRRKLEHQNVELAIANNTPKIQSEPVESDYKSSMGYQAALRLWRNQK